MGGLEPVLCLIVGRRILGDGRPDRMAWIVEAGDGRLLAGPVATHAEALAEAARLVGGEELAAVE